MPEEIVFEGWDHIQEQYSELVLDGLLMQVQPISPHQVRIVRLISPNPQHYLNPAYAPGQLIEYKPSVK
jgi:hypothetical protein